MVRTAAPSWLSAYGDTSSLRKSTSRPSRCNSANICIARSGGSSAGFAAVGGATAVEGTGFFSNAAAMSCGMTPWNSSAKKQRSAYATRVVNGIIENSMNIVQELWRMVQADAGLRSADRRGTLHLLGIGALRDQLRGFLPGHTQAQEYSGQITKINHPCDNVSCVKKVNGCHCATPRSDSSACAASKTCYCLCSLYRTKMNKPPISVNTATLVRSVYRIEGARPEFGPPPITGEGCCVRNHRIDM